MLVIPAIDLYAGRCVRLFQGSFSRTTRYADDPADRARGFADLGAAWLHIVDLDAAEGKGADNRAVIARIRAAVSCRIQVGGGIRSEGDAGALVDRGIDRVVVGTALIRSPDEVAGWASRLEGRLAAGIDARDGRVKVAGWAEDAGISDLDAAHRLAGLGLIGLVYTNISRDGTLAGPDIERTRLAARAAGLPTILSGGIGSEKDVRAVFDCHEPLVRGVILGKALYEGAVDLKTLLDRFTRDREAQW
jgi:phosphoribosylformimino-5-aminoimidazole carboxamide ribotide isomerase